MVGLRPVFKRNALGIFFLLAFTLAWLFYPLIIISPVFAVASLMTPAVAAWIVITVADGRFGTIRLRRRLSAWRVDPLWYAAAIGLPAALSLAAAYGGRLLGATAPIRFTPISPLALVFILMAAGEEIGWRGYALPKLLEIYSPAASSVILGLLWGLWRLPSFIQPSMLLFGVPAPVYLIYSVALSVMFTLIHKHTRGSVVLAVVLHAATNIFVFVNPSLGLETRWWLTAGVYFATAVVVLLVGGPDLKFDRPKKLRPMENSSNG